MNSSTTPRIAVIRHLAFEDLGVFAAEFSDRGMAVEIYDAGVDDTAGPLETSDLAIVLGGPIGTYETERYPFLRRQTEALRQRLRAARPTLGICLGAQLIAAALGARVYPGGGKEIGWGEVELTAAAGDSPLTVLAGVPVLHWHGDTFDLPPGATLLASTACYPHQAFAIGRNLLGLQFHVEVDVRRIEQWLIGHTCELVAAGIDPAELRARTAELPPGISDAGRRLLADWLDALEW